MRTSTINKKHRFKKAAFLLIVLTIINYACTADAVLIDTSLKLPPVPLNTEGWEVLEYTSQEDNDGEGANNGRVWNTFDGDPDTFWHTCWNGCTPTPPHSFVIDMLDEKQLNGIIFTQRQSLSRNIEVLSIEISTDNSSWTNLGEFSLEKIKASQEKVFAETITARYFKINVIKVYDGSDNAALAEIAPYF